MLASPPSHDTLRSRVPEPQRALQRPQGRACHAQGASPRQGCCVGGPGPWQREALALTQEVLRCCVPRPQPALQADQPPTVQWQKSRLRQAREAGGRGPGQPASTGHQTSRLSAPSPQSAEQAPQPEACQAQAAVELQACAAGGLGEEPQSASLPLAQRTLRCCVPGPQALLQRDQPEAVQLQALAPLHSLTPTGRSGAAQSPSAPGQATLRRCRPGPHCALQAPQSPACHAQPSRP